MAVNMYMYKSLRNTRDIKIEDIYAELFVKKFVPNKSESKKILWNDFKQTLMKKTSIKTL